MLFGLLLPALLGFATLSVDTAVIATARDQLSTAADASTAARRHRSNEGSRHDDGEWRIGHRQGDG